MLGVLQHRRSMHRFFWLLSLSALLTWAGEAQAQWTKRLRFSGRSQQDTLRVMLGGEIPLPTVGTTVAERGAAMRLDFKDTLRMFRDGVDVASGRVLLRGPDTPVTELIVYFAYEGPEGMRVPVAFDTTDTEGRYHLVAPNPTSIRYEIMTKPVERITLKTTSAVDADTPPQSQVVRRRKP